MTEEQYKLAAELRDHISVLREELSPVQQLLFHKLQQLDYGSFAEQQSALKSIGTISPTYLNVALQKQMPKGL